MNHWYFWVLAPVMMLGGIIIPLVARPTSVGGHVLAYAIGGTLWIATLGLANPRKFWWALRAVAAAVLVAALWYFASEALEWWAGEPLGAFGRRSSSSLWNAGFFLLVFGLPALRYLISGRSGSAADAIAAQESFVESNASAPQALGSDDGLHDKRTG
jgi:hypothetical protein